MSVGRAKPAERAYVCSVRILTNLRRYGQRAHALGGSMANRRLTAITMSAFAAFVGFADRHVIDQAAVDQLSPSRVIGASSPGNRHAGAHGRRQAAFANDHALAVADVGGNQRAATVARCAARPGWRRPAG